MVFVRRMRRGGLRSRVTAVAAACSCVAGVVLAPAITPAATADTQDEKNLADQQVAALEAALEGTTAELAQAFLALQDTQAKLPAAEAAQAKTAADARAAAVRNAEVATMLAVARANEARVTDAIAKNTAALDTTQRTLDAFAAEMFQGGEGSQLSVALGATSPDDFATRIVLADAVTSLTNDTLRDLQTMRADRQAQQAYLVAVRAEVAQLKREAEAAFAAADAAKAQAAQAKASLDALVSAQSQHASDVESRKGAEQQRLAAAEAEQARLQAELVEQARRAREAEAARIAAEAAAAAAAAQAGKSYTPPARETASSGGAFLSYPANGPITSEFGLRFHPILHVWKLHTGTDFGLACGTPVYATAGGRVISAGWGGGNGNRIVIDHGIQRGVDLVTTYNHLSSFAVRSGVVQRGQLIGYSGTTGYSTGCHLHFETLQDGSFVNPRTWI